MAANEQKTALASQAAQEQRVRDANEVVLKAQAEAKEADANLAAEQKSYDDRITDLTAKSQSSTIGLVAKNRAANELAQAKNEDPLPLTRAKVTQEAVVRKAEKAAAQANIEVKLRQLNK